MGKSVIDIDLIIVVYYISSSSRQITYTNREHLNLHTTDTYTKELPADPILDNVPRQVHSASFSYVTPKKTAGPTLLHASELMADTIGLSTNDLKSSDFLNIFSGNAIIPGSKSYAMCYGGHQFGHWAGQLGDGRAINLGQVSHQDLLWTLQLKGAGPTPYSRTADGLAVLRSSIREYLCSEAMYHLGVPTTRALSLMLTGDQVMRDMLYDGNRAYEKGAVVCRVAPSFLRFGSFEIFAARKDIDNLKTLTDYTIRHHYPHLGTSGKETYIALFKEVAERTLDMIIHWQRVGFVHGVMNTDNLSILGLTIDYGPYGWLEGYDYSWTPNTTDRQHKRYRYGNQPNIGLWNLAQLANALYPLINEAAPLEDILKAYKDQYDIKSLKMMQSKLGLTDIGRSTQDGELVASLRGLLQATETDMTIFFRNLGDFQQENPKNGMDTIKQAFYHADQLPESMTAQWSSWFESYAIRLQEEHSDDRSRKAAMNLVNPKYVLRNYMAQLAIDDADKGDYGLIEELYTMLQKPYDNQPEYQQWFAKRPEWARHKVGCSMLSCSS